LVIETTNVAPSAGRNTSGDGSLNWQQDLLLFAHNGYRLCLELSLNVLQKIMQGKAHIQKMDDKQGIIRLGSKPS